MVSPWYPLKHVPASFAGVSRFLEAASGQVVVPTVGAPLVRSPPMSSLISVWFVLLSALSWRVGLFRSRKFLTRALSVGAVFRACASRR